MTSVAKPTIFDVVDGAWFQDICRLCQKPIRFGWAPRPGEPHSTWTPQLLFWRLCRDCVIGAAAADVGPRSDTLDALRRHYRRIESVWHFAGFGDPGEGTSPLLWAKQQVVRQALRVGRETPTLRLTRWYPPRQHKGQNDPYLELFQITGRLPVASISAVSYQDFSGYQRFALAEREVAGQREVCATVKIAINACYPPADPTRVHWRWDPWMPNEETEPVIHRFGYCSNENLALLVSHAARIYYKAGRSGRTRDETKRYPPGTETAFLQDVKSVIAKREDDGLTLTKVEMLADDMAMSKSALYEMFKRAPEAHDLYHEHRRRTPRHNRRRS